MEFIKRRHEKERIIRPNASRTTSSIPDSPPEARRANNARFRALKITSYRDKDEEALSVGSFFCIKSSSCPDLEGPREVPTVIMDVDRYGIMLIRTPCLLFETQCRDKNG